MIQRRTLLVALCLLLIAVPCFADYEIGQPTNDPNNPNGYARCVRTYGYEIRSGVTKSSAEQFAAEAAVARIAENLVFIKMMVAMDYVNLQWVGDPELVNGEEITITSAYNQQTQQWEARADYDRQYILRYITPEL